MHSSVSEFIGNQNINIYNDILEEIKINPNSIWAIYGTGNGAELVYRILCELAVNAAVKYIIDQDEKAIHGVEFHGIPIKKLREVSDGLEGIIIAAMDHHDTIKARIRQNLNEKQKRYIRVIDIFGEKKKRIQIANMTEYVEYIEKGILKASPEFVCFDEQGYQAKACDTKVIAWYLPQYHQIDINNKFHGQGFTEWVNTSRAIPMFAGHYQPHIPYDVGYYDLMNPSAIKRQAYLARHYGIYGFCFHYYWFSGRKLMEKPLEIFLEHEEIDMPFCLDWATENWTALWDGGNREIMIEQRLMEGDGRRFMEDILPYMRDPRYIRMEGKPVLIIYRIDLFEKSQAKILLDNFRDIAKEQGFPDLYIMLTNAFRFSGDLTEWGADAIVEFPPHMVWDLVDTYKLSGYVNPYFNGTIYDVTEFIESKKYMLNHGAKAYFRSALTAWDNTARRGTSGASIFYGFSPETFKSWLRDIVAESKKIHSAENDIVFVNSWNEWAEGSHLEPDMKYGYAYLQKVKEVLEEQRKI